MARLLNDSFEDKNVGFFVRIIYFEILFWLWIFNSLRFECKKRREGPFEQNTNTRLRMSRVAEKSVKN